MLMRGNALVLKAPVENAPRTSIEKHLSWSPDIPPAARFPLHRSRPAEYQPNRQPATVGAESRVGRRRGRGLCGLVCPSSTSEHGGEGDCVKEGDEKGSARGSVHWGCDYATSLDIEVDPQRRRFGRRESDFAHQRLVECRAFVPERVRLVALRWHSSGSEVRLGLPVGL